MDLASTALIVLVPGIGATFAAYRPGRVGLATRLALAFVFGYAGVGLLSFALVVLRIFNPATFFVPLAMGTAAVWWFGLRKGSLRDHGRAIAEEVKADPWSIGAGLAVIAVIAVMRLAFSGYLNFLGHTPFRYWADAVEIADIGRVPDSTLQWGNVYPPTVSKIVLNSFNAGVSFATGRDLIPALFGLLWVGSVGLSVVLWALGRELGLRLTAPLLPVLTVVNRAWLGRELTDDMDSYKAEIFGRTVAFAALLVAIRALRDRKGWKEPVLAGALFGVGAGTHLVPVLIALMMLGAYGLARLVLDRDLRALLVRAAAMGIAAVVFAGGILTLAGGDIGFGGAGGGSKAYRDLALELNVPGNFDPTLYLTARTLVQFTHFQSGGWYDRPIYSYRQFVRAAIRLPPKPWWRWGLAIGGLAAALLMLVFFPPALRPIGLVAWGLGAGIMLVTLVFNLRYDVFILARFGQRRLNDYASIPVILLLLALGEAAVLLLGRVRSWLPGAAGVAAVALVGALVIPSGRPIPGQNSQGRLAADPLTWVREEMPCDVRILASQRTLGVFQTLTGRVGVIEGMGPYLRPAILKEAIRSLVDAERFFQDPGANTRFLVKEGVDYVLVSKGGLSIGGTGQLTRMNVWRFRYLPFLRLQYLTPGVEIYRVVGLGESGADLVDPVGRPGYHCEREPLEGPPPAVVAVPAA